MKPFVSAAALAAALALPGLPAMAQTTTDTDTQQTTTQTDSQQTTTATEPTEAAPGEFKVISSADDLEGLNPEEVRIEDVDKAPRDQVQAINSSLDPSNPEAVQLREQISGMDAVKQALSDENIEEERVVGAALNEGSLVLYVLPES
jgi:hypothetical protein